LKNLFSGVSNVFILKAAGDHFELYLWVHSPNTKHVRVCVHVECSCILGVVDSCSSIYVVLWLLMYGERQTKEASHMTSCTVTANDNGSGDVTSPEWDLQHIVVPTISKWFETLWQCKNHNIAFFSPVLRSETHIHERNPTFPFSEKGGGKDRLPSIHLAPKSRAKDSHFHPSPLVSEEHITGGVCNSEPNDKNIL
jgi:hypothetical protein